MAHPSIEEILSVPDRVAHHLQECAACRALSSLAEPTPPAAPRTQELPVVDRAMYADFQALPGGRGGMGQLYQARDVRLGRLVAIKQLHEPDDATPPAVRAGLRRRFEREARLTARLEHPAIVGVHEAGRWPDGEPFYAMRFVAGRSLDDEIAGRAGVAERISLLASVTIVADAVAYAHERGIVHRDVKPRNILVGRHAEAVLIDWGLAKDLQAPPDDPPAPGEHEADDGLTQLGVGTPQYMPPEQAKGQDADPRMDVYALGATIYHVLAGEPPYGRGSATEVRRRLLVGPPRALGELSPAVPSELQAIVAKAMHRDPAERFPSARELADELHRYQTGQLLRTHSYTARQLVAHWVRRHRTVLRMAAAGLVAVVALGAWSVARIVRERNRAEESARDARRAQWRAQGVTASRLATSSASRLEGLTLGVASVAPALQAGEQPPPEAVQGLLDAIVEAPTRRSLGGPRGHASGMDASRDTSRVIVSSDDGAADLWDIPGLKVVASHRFSLIPNRLYLSPAGERAIACGTRDRAELWSVGDDRTVVLPSREVTIGCGFLDEENVVTAAEDVVVRDAAGAEVHRLALDHPASALAVSQDGRVAVGQQDGTVIAWDPRSGGQERAHVHTAQVNALAFAASGSLLVSAGGDGRLFTYEPGPAGRVTRLLDEGIPLASVVNVSPSGRFVVAATHSGYSHARVLMLDRNAGSPRGRPMGWLGGFARDESMAVVGNQDTLVVFDPQGWRGLLSLEDQNALSSTLSPDRTRLVAEDFDSGQLELWDLRTGRASGVWLGHSDEITGLWPSADRSRLLTASIDGSARVWDLRSGAAVALLQAGAALLGAAWSPDGERILTAATDGLVRTYGPDGKPLSSFDAHAPVLYSAFAPRGDRVITCAADGSVVVWDAATGAPKVHVSNDPDTATVAATFSADGKTVFAGAVDGTVRAWDASTGAPGARSRPLDADARNGTSALAFTPDGGSLLASTASLRTFVLDPKTLQVRAELEGRAPSSWSTSFDRRGHRFLAVARDGRVLVHDLVGSAPPQVLQAGRATVLAAAFSDDGERIVIADAAGASSVWSAHDAALLYTLAPRRLGPATAAAFAPDGQAVIVGFGTGAVRSLPATLEAALDLACGTLEALGRADARYCDRAWKSWKTNAER